MTQPRYPNHFVIFSQEQQSFVDTVAQVEEDAQEWEENNPEFNITDRTLDYKANGPNWVVTLLVSYVTNDELERMERQDRKRARSMSQGLLNDLGDFEDDDDEEED